VSVRHPLRFSANRIPAMPRIMTLLAIVGIAAACYFTWRYGVAG
jgi:hypothetical protein